MSRITLITKFKEKELNNQLKNIHYHMCKVPYGINDELALYDYPGDMIKEISIKE